AKVLTNRILRSMILSKRHTRYGVRAWAAPTLPRLVPGHHNPDCSARPHRPPRGASVSVETQATVPSPSPRRGGGFGGAGPVAVGPHARSPSAPTRAEPKLVLTTGD